ncbi:MAG: T9SS type A sorting domain-containing protein [Ignavibacteriae bacterium]|nr:T9SS type A sorting domain-containing protein [Ignavibacteriota bacterium]
MKKVIYTLLILTCVFALNLQAQTPQYYNSNTGTSSNSFPFNMAAGKAINSIILAGEFGTPTPLPAGQKITTVYFRTNTAGTRTYTDLRILMAQGTITTLTSGVFDPGPYDTVYYNASATLTSTVGGWMAVTLNHPFVYDVTKSLIIFVGQCGYTGTGASVFNSTTGYTGIRRVWSVGGCPFAPYAGGDVSMLNFGVDVVPATPPPPVLLTPANNAAGVSITPTFVWNKSTDVATTNYWWQLTTDSTGLANLQNDSLLTDTTKSASGLTNLTKYFWRVKAKSPAGWGAFSGWFNFTTLSQLYYNSNLGANANSFPFGIAAGKMVQWLVLAGEINQPTPAPLSLITNFSVRIATGYPLASTTYSSFNILLGQTTITSLTSGVFYSGTMDTVYKRTSVTLSAAADTWLTFALDHPFPYNPAQSLVVQIEQCAGAGATGFPLAHTNLTGNRRVWSVGGCPFAPYAGAGVNVLNCGINILPVSSVGQITSQIPKEYKLEQNYPNPFNPVTKISYDIPKTGLISIKIYDILGKEISSLVNEVKNAGSYTVDFDGTSFASGTYFYRLETNGFVATKKMMLIK